MDLSFTSEQLLLRDAVHDYMRREVDKSDLIAAATGRIGHDAATWHRMAEMGWLGLGVPPSLGGAGGGALDMAIVLEGLGSGPMPGPIIETTAITPSMLQACPTTDATETLLQHVADGTAVVTVAWPHSCGLPPIQSECSLVLSGTTLTGKALPVREASSATHVILIAKDDSAPSGWSLAILPTNRPGVTIRSLPGFVAQHHGIDVDSVTLGHDDVAHLDTASLSAIRRAVLATAPLLCALQIGSSQATLRMSIEYSNERIQFGRPIGSFQRVQDHVIDLLNNVDCARWSTYYALALLDSHGPEDPSTTSAIHVAKALTSRAHMRACDSAHEVHAGIGADVDYGLAPHTYLSRGLYGYLGDPAWHRAALTSVLGLLPHDRGAP